MIGAEGGLLDSVQTVPSVQRQPLKGSLRHWIKGRKTEGKKKQDVLQGKSCKTLLLSI